MSDLVQILPLWEALRTERIDYVLATVVDVAGSGYRKPGARMLVAADGRRAGTISGGCLEGEVARKAFWQTENGPVLRRYSTSPDDGDIPYGMGCGGVVQVLLEHSCTAELFLQHLAAAFAARQPLAAATVIEGDSIGKRAFWPTNLIQTATAPTSTPSSIHDPDSRLVDLALQAYSEHRSFTANVESEDRQIAGVRAEWIAARPGLFVFGAGDDALPLLALAAQLGWYTAVADGRAHLATRKRFPHADALHLLTPGTAFSADLRATDTAVVMTHSLQQDTQLLAHLLQQNLAYLGVLGPRRRTREMLESIANQQFSNQDREIHIEGWFKRLHAPMGLDLGGNAPADIALAVIAEIQQTLHHASGQALRQLRAHGAERTPIAFQRNTSIA